MFPLSETPCILRTHWWAWSRFTLQESPSLIIMNYRQIYIDVNYLKTGMGPGEGLWATISSLRCISETKQSKSFGSVWGRVGDRASSVRKFQEFCAGTSGIACSPNKELEQESEKTKCPGDKVVKREQVITVAAKQGGGRQD